MVHRRKNAHPVCKTRRNLNLTSWAPIDEHQETKEDLDIPPTTNEEDNLPTPDEEPVYEYEIPENLPECISEIPHRITEVPQRPIEIPQCSVGMPHVTSASFEATPKTDGQQIMIPEDLYKDFEAVRSKTKMDATDLMRRLLKDYQSISNQQIEDEQEAGEIHVNRSPSLQRILHANQSISPLARERTKVATITSPQSEDKGLDLSLRPNKKSVVKSEGVDFTTNNTGGSGNADKPLDLSVTPRDPDSLGPGRREITPPGIENTQIQGNSELPMNFVPIQNAENFMYVYPINYNGPELGGIVSPALAGVIPPGSESTQKEPPDAHQSSDLGVINTNLSFGSIGDINSIPLPPSYCSPTNSPAPSTKQCDSVFLQESKKSLPKYFRMSSAKHRQGSSDVVPPPPKYQKPKEEKEMKIISENTSYPGVYTSVLKLPWSRRTRTKKSHLSKRAKQEVQEQQLQLEQQQQQQQQQGSVMMIPVAGKNTHVPQPATLPENMLAQQELTATSNSITVPQLNGQPGLTTDPANSQSVMMVYPNSAISALGKPVRKRGRPPKLPMLARLLQQSNRRSKKDKNAAANAALQAQLVQQAQANGGMVLYNASGQVLSALGGLPVQQLPVSAEQAQLHGQNLLGPQAQFIGQFQLQPQVAAAQLQLPPQLATQMQPIPGQLTQLPGINGQVQGLNQEVQQGEGQTEPTVASAVLPTSISYAFQPVLIPTPVTTTATETATSEPQTIETPNSQSEQGVVNIDQSATSIDGLNIPAGSTHVMAHADTNTISTMSTTSIANTGSGAIYQEMILSSKSLVDIKPRRRQTAIQLLKSKSSDQNFICTSFRIRPRLVAQAQAQRERLAAKCMKNIAEAEERNSIPKNLSVPQNDEDCHFGDLNNIDHFEMNMHRRRGRGKGRGKKVPPLKIKIKQEAVEYSEVTDRVEELGDAGLLDTINIKKEIVEEGEEQQVIDNRESSNEYSTNTSEKRYIIPDPSTERLPQDFLDDPASDNMSCDSPVTREMPSSYDDSSLSMESMFEESMSQDMFQELYHCKVCNEILPIEEKLSHWRKHIPLKYVCKKCGAEYTNADFSSKPGEQGEDASLTCDTCQETVTKEDVEVNSPSQGKQSKALNCEECGENFHSFQKLYDHQSQVHKDSTKVTREYTCDRCGKIYHNFRALFVHRKSHREKALHCPTEDCNRTFHSIAEMEKHVISRHSDKKQYYHCIYDGCPKKFLKNFHLQEHIRVKHFNIKAFQCPWPGCQKEFAAERHMKVHLLIHRDEKPLKCDYCDYRCRQRSAMNWHMRKHPEVPYKYKRYVNSPSASAPESE